jgi:uncharacterized protein
VPHPTQTPYTVDVYDLLHRPGEMRERTLSVTVPEDIGTEIIGVKAGSTLDIEQPVQVEIQELFAYSQDEAFEYGVQVDTIDLEPVIRDAVVLSLPFQPVCQEDCLGLCPQCGVRLLDNPGHEHEAPVDPRWAALAGLDGLIDAGGNAHLIGTEDVAGTSTGATEEKR